MELTKNNYHNVNVNFGARKAPTVDDLKYISKFVDCSLNGFNRELIDSVEKKAPHLIREADGFKYIADFSIGQKITNAVKSFCSIPLDILDSVAKKFPNSRLDKAGFIQKHRSNVLLENEVNAYQGLMENALEFVTESSPKGWKAHPVNCSPRCHMVCEDVQNKFNKELNKQMAYDVADYDTKKERFAARIISGFTAAFFLGNDFYNKSIQKGKTVEEAKKEQHLKQGQEIKENICEAITQFGVFACFSKTVNQSPMGAALIGTGIGLVSRVISRLASGMPIARIKAPDKKYKMQMPSMKDFTESVKANETPKNEVKFIKTEENKKKPLLSLKNIALFCGLSILGGYALRFGKNHTEIGKTIAERLAKHKEKVNSQIIEDIYADKQSVLKLSNILNASGEQKLSEKVLQLAKGPDKIYLGSDYKRTSVFGVEMSTKDLRGLASAPFRFVKELVSYPYKIANKLETAIKNSRLKAQNLPIPTKKDPTKDIYDIRNLYRRFTDFQKKYGNDEQKLGEEFGKYVKHMRIMSNNKISSSSGDNSKIAVLAQTLGTLTGMWFNMNDEFNSSVRNGSSKSEAEKDARLRGINKFFRMTVQVIISGGLNSIFFKQYNNSVAKAGAVVAASTLLTDMASRVLSGMPNKKMTKEELEQYQKEHKEGSMAWYYKLIDKLAS